jgi:hypothetical protein
MMASWDPSDNDLLFNSASEGAGINVNLEMANFFSLDNDVQAGCSPVSTSVQHDWLLDPSTGEVIDGFNPAQTQEPTKRSRIEGDESDINACWKSPLCPHSHDNGQQPNTCQGECADFLFAKPESLPEEKQYIAEMMTRSKPKIAVETHGSQKRSSKRSEPESSPESMGRESRTSEEFMKSSPSTPEASLSSSAAKAKGRVPHNQVERKYRENVNSQLEALRRAIPLKQHLSSFAISSSVYPETLALDIEDIANASSTPRQISKAVVLSSATTYIKMLERENAKLKTDMEKVKTEMEELKGQNRTLQGLPGLVNSNCDDCGLLNYVRRLKIHGS